MDISMTSTTSSDYNYNPHRGRTYPLTKYPIPSYEAAPNHIPSYLPTPLSHLQPPVSTVPLPPYDLMPPNGEGHPFSSPWSAAWEAQVVTYTSVRGYVAGTMPTRNSPSPSKRARIESAGSEVSRDIVVEKVRVAAEWTAKPTPFSRIPVVNPKPFIPDVSMIPVRPSSRGQRSQSPTSDTASDAGSTTTTLIENEPARAVSPPASRSSSRSSLNVNKKLPPAPAPPATPVAALVPPPSLPAPAKNLTLIDLPNAGELSSNFVFAAPKSKARSSKSQPPHIIRTQAQSVSVLGGLKAVWKKATAQIRSATRNGSNQRQSALWSGFAPVEPPSPHESSGSGRRMSLWFMSGNQSRSSGSPTRAVFESPPQEVEMQPVRPLATRTRTGSTESSAGTFVTALTSR